MSKLKFLLSKFHESFKRAVSLKKSGNGFVILMTILILPVALYCILLAVNYMQIYSVHLKVRRALLASAYEVAMIVNRRTTYDSSSAEYRTAMLLAEETFINALGAQLNGVSNEQVSMLKYSLSTSSSGNIYKSINSTSSKKIDYDRLQFVATSVLSRLVKLKGATEFVLKSCACEKGEEGSEKFDDDKWIFSLYPASESTGFRDANYLGERWEKSSTYTHSVLWNCKFEFMIPGNARIEYNDPVFNLNASRVMVKKRRYQRDADIDLGYGAKTRLSRFSLSIKHDRDNKRINIRTACQYTFQRNDLSGTSNVNVDVGRTIAVPTSAGKAVDIAIALPIQKISKIKDKIVKFIKRFDSEGVQIALVPYSGSVVAPKFFKDQGWIAVYKPQSYKAKEIEIKDSYSMKFEIHNSLLPRCLKDFKYAKKITDYNGCPKEYKEVCSRHHIIGTEFLYYPSIRHFYAPTSKSSYPQGVSKWQSGNFLNLPVSSPTTELNVKYVPSAGRALQNLNGISYLLVGNIQVAGSPIAISHSARYCANCGAPCFNNAPCSVCGKSSSNALPSFYSSGNLATISMSDFASLSASNVSDSAFDSMSAAIDDTSPTGCKWLGKNDGKTVALTNVYVGVDGNGLHVLATELPESALESKQGINKLGDVNSGNDNYAVYLVPGGSGSVSPANSFLNSKHYIFWNINTFDNVMPDSPVTGDVASITAALNSQSNLKNICANAKVVVYDGCNCTEKEVVKEIRCQSSKPYMCANKMLDQENPSESAYPELVFKTPKYLEVTGECPTEGDEMSQSELAEACLEGYVKHELFYSILDELGIDKANLAIDISGSSMSDTVKIEIKKVSVVNTPEHILDMVTTALRAPTSSFRLYKNNVLTNGVYGNKDAQSSVYVSTVKNGDSAKMLYPGLSVSELYHSTAKTPGQDSPLYTAFVPNTYKIMYPTATGESMMYDEELDTSIKGPPIVRVFALNNKPCIGTHGNLTNIGGWGDLTAATDFSTSKLLCRTIPEPLDTHSYEMRELTSNVVDTAFYTSLMVDTVEKSSFQYLGLVWAARFINYDNVTMYATRDDKVRGNAKKVIVFIATTGDNFADNELTSLGLSKDNSDAVLNDSEYNITIGKDKRPVDILTKRAKKVIDNIQSAMPECAIYPISYNEEGADILNPTIRNFNLDKPGIASSPDELDALLTGIADQVLLDIDSNIKILE